MPRRARTVVPNYPHHIIQRGHNRQVVFVGDEDYLYYLENLKEWKDKVGCKVYAYCLMTNHVHLLVEPTEQSESLALLMKRVAGRQTRYVNKLEGRCGTLWEGRYKSSPVDKDEYLLACGRYIELNPVRAGIAAAPQDYRWSSFQHRAGLVPMGWLDTDPCYSGLGDSDSLRGMRYKQWVEESIPDNEWDLIRKALQRGQLTGSGRFVEEIESKVGKRIETRGQGRPKAAKELEK